MSKLDVYKWITDFNKKWDEHKDELKEAKNLQLILSMQKRIDEVLATNQEVRKYSEPSMSMLPGWKNNIANAQTLLDSCPLLTEWKSNKSEMEKNGTLLRNQKGKNFDERKQNYIRENLATWLKRVLIEPQVKLPVPLKDIRKINPYLAEVISEYTKNHGKASLEDLIQSQIK